MVMSKIRTINMMLFLKITMIRYSKFLIKQDYKSVLPKNIVGVIGLEITKALQERTINFINNDMFPIKIFSLKEMTILENYYQTSF